MSIAFQLLNTRPTYRHKEGTMGWVLIAVAVITVGVLVLYTKDIDQWY